MLDDGFYFVGMWGQDYTKFPAKLKKFVQYSQNPIKPDVLTFETDIDTIMPEYAEIIYVKDGQHRFHGDIVKRVDEKTYWACEAEAIQRRLDYRYIPEIIYSDQDVNRVLASDAPDMSIHFGSRGAYSGSVTANFIWMTKYQAERDITARFFWIYAMSAYSSWQAVIYEDNSGTPAARKVVIPSGMSLSVGWNCLPMPETNLTEGSYYWIAVINSTPIIGLESRSGTSNKFTPRSYSGYTLPDPAPTMLYTSTTAPIMAYVSDYGYNNVGALFALQSAIPNGQWVPKNSGDLLMGNTSDVHTDTIPINYIYAFRFKVNHTGDALYLFLHASTNSSKVKYAIYADYGGTPFGARTVYVNTDISVVAGWNKLTIPSAFSVVDGDYYWICILCDTTRSIALSVSGDETVYKYSQAYSGFSWGTGLPGGSWSTVTGYNLLAYITDYDNLMDITTMKLANGGKKSALRELPLYASTNIPFGVTNDGYDLVRVLTEEDSEVSMADDTFYRNDDDLYIAFGDGSYMPNAFLVFAAYWLDCKIRLGSIEWGEYVPAIPLSLAGQASKSFDDFFERLGQELQFLPSPDGYVYMNSGLPIARGDETHPVRTYTDRQNCTIELRDKIEPDVQSAIGVASDNSPPICITDWSRISGPQLFRIIDAKGRMEEDVRTELVATILNNQDSFNVITDADFSLRVGDYVRVSGENITTQVLRVRSIEIEPPWMKIEVGKRPFDLSNEFGKKWALDEEGKTQIVSAKELTDGAGAFTVLGSNVADKLYKCYYEVGFENAVDDSEISPDAFMTLEINGKIIPPGRIKIDGSSVKIDITRYVITDPDDDVENTIEPHFYNLGGWTASTLGVEQKQGQSFSGNYAGGENWLGCA